MPSDSAPDRSQDRVAGAAARWEARPVVTRLAAALLAALILDALAIALIALLWQKDRTGALVAAAVPGALTLLGVTWFTVAPGDLLRRVARGSQPRGDMGSRPWTTP